MAYVRLKRWKTMKANLKLKRILDKEEASKFQKILSSKDTGLKIKNMDEED
jgi:hypothetical protein